ncbi:MAG: ESX secretion-associated protein EspG [Mycobacterium sp.]|nr:ESX secretion-associated protein EspG [Mycobacterium sp.]MBV9722483.1 ESX secretion-associated protein EspG [Mycobacterium sp.]
MWVLQALLGVESMPVALHLKPFIPSAHRSLIVETDAGTVPLAHTAQYHSLVQAGVIDKGGRVDDVVRDWMKVLGRPDREVVLVIRRPSGLTTDDDAPTVCERVMVICVHRRWMAMAARDGSEIVIGGVGEAQDPDRQIELMCRVLVPAFGESVAADIDGVNVQMDALLAAMGAAAPAGRDAVSAALAKVGLPPREVEVVTAATRLDESAMAVVSLIDHGPQIHPYPRVLTVADTDFGRVSFTTMTGADGKQWMSIWPTTPASLRDDLTDLLSARRVA